jgi:putative transposase
MDDKLCLLVVMGVDDTGRKEVLTVVDGYRESEASWLEVLTQLQSQGMTIAPELAIGDGALGFWNAVTKFWPTTRHQRCWVHKTANILNKVPKSVQPRMKESLQDIWMAETRDEAYKAFRLFEQRYGAKYPKATDCLVKDKDEMLAFYDFPAEHWTHTRTTNPIESMFATVRLRTNKTKSCGSRKTTLAMAFKLMKTAESNWRRLRGFKLLADVIRGVKFQDGIRKTEEYQQDIALESIHQI